MQKFKLSILLVTFNHEDYIHQAMRSILAQNVEGSIELIVADDGSTDQTREIIRSYDGTDPRFHFKYLNHFPNLGITKNYQRGFAACSGQYVAVIEGDDYWCSPHKLQRQCDFLDTQLQCGMCSVNYFVFEEARAQFTPRTSIGSSHRYLGARDLIADNLVGNFSTCMYRKDALRKLPDRLFEIKSYDWIVNICVGVHSLIGFIEEPMSVYRLHSGGTWTQTSHMDKLKVQLELIPFYDDLTGNIFHVEFSELSDQLSRIITATAIAPIVEPIVAQLTRTTPRVREYFPPFLVFLAKFILPPALKSYLLNVARRLIGFYR